MKIAIMAFGINSISNVSGMERVFVNMSNEMSRRGHTVYAIWNGEEGEEPFYKLDQSVRKYNLGLGKIKVPYIYKVEREISKFLNLPIINRADQYKYNKIISSIMRTINIDKIDIFICYEMNSALIAQKLAKGIKPVVGMVHGNVEREFCKVSKRQIEVLSKLDLYQVLTPQFKKDLERILDTPVIVIPNAVKQTYLSKIERNKKSKYTILSVGRIEGENKRPFITIKSFAEICHKYPHWVLDFYGPITDQSYMQEIQKFIKERGLEKRISYKGVSENLQTIYENADILGFPSKYEGFSMVVTEAMEAGLPVLGFKTSPGVNEMITNNYNGFLVESEEEYIEKLELLLADCDLRNNMSIQAHKSVEKLSNGYVWDLWEETLNELVRNYSDNIN